MIDKDNSIAAAQLLALIDPAKPTCGEYCAIGGALKAMSADFETWYNWRYADAAIAADSAELRRLWNELEHQKDPSLVLKVYAKKYPLQGHTTPGKATKAALPDLFDFAAQDADTPKGAAIEKATPPRPTQAARSSTTAQHDLEDMLTTAESKDQISEPRAANRAVLDKMLIQLKLPPMLEAGYLHANRPQVPPPLIHGILRRAQKMTLAAPPKAGKTWLLIDLALSLIIGGKWLNFFECERGQVLYINLELSTPSFWQRLETVAQARGVDLGQVKDSLRVWTLKGINLNELIDPLTMAIEVYGINAVIIDPAYKVIAGDENSAREMGEFCRKLDLICKAGSALIMSHHFSKAPAGERLSMYLPSGSNVFSRDPDALLTLTPMKHREDATEAGAELTPYRLEAVLREFSPLRPLGLIFRYPLYEIDLTGELLRGSTKAAKRESAERDQERRAWIEEHNPAITGEPITVNDFAADFSLTRWGATKWLRREGYTLEKRGKVTEIILDGAACATVTSCELR